MPNLIQWYGWQPDRPDQRDKLYRTVAPPAEPLPPMIDLTAECTPVEDQGPIGSCTANALVGNLEFLKQIAGYGEDELSRLFVYFNERDMEGTADSDCGASLRDGIKSLAALGVCAERSWPYDPAKFAVKPTDDCYAEAEEHQISSYHRILSVYEMKRCLVEGYPFVFGFSVYESFESTEVAQTGVLNLPGPNERQMGGHAVMAVGFDDDTQRFLIRNSWGADWGKGGYFTMPYDYIANANLADDFWTIRAYENQ